MSDPTFADVASRTVDHLAAGVKTMSDAVQKIAPHAWEIAVRQQRVEALGDIVLCALVLVALAALARVVIKTVRAVNEDESNVEHIVAISRIICLVAIGLIMIPVFSGYGLSGAQRLANPEYYAAQALLQAIK